MIVKMMIMLEECCIFLLEDFFIYRICEIMRVFETEDCLAPSEMIER